MLWYKAWLETRWRFVFMVGSILLVWLLPLWLPSHSAVPASRLWFGLQLGSVLLSMLAAIYLAGSGINSQTMYAATTGFHGSMLFTLSLPVSRRRLLFVRAGLGAILTGVLVICMTAYILLHRPGAVSASLALSYIARVLVCTMAVYSLSVLLACVFDEVWQFMGGCLVWSGVFLLQTRFAAVAWVSPIRGMSQISYSGNGTASWPPLLASILLTGILLSASVLFLQRKEY
jgi:hypothetical protein